MFVVTVSRQIPMAASRAGVYIRNAGPNDAPGIASVLHDSFIEFVSLYTPQGYAATALNACEVGQRMAEGPVWVATLHDAIVGTISAVQKSCDSLYVRGMAVLPSARGQAVGGILLNTVETFAFDNGCRRLFLSTTPFLAAAIRLYERFDFKRTADGPHNLFGTPLFTMSKELNPANVIRSHQ